MKIKGLLSLDSCYWSTFFWALDWRIYKLTLLSFSSGGCLVLRKYGVWNVSFQLFIKYTYALLCVSSGLEYLLNESITYHNYIGHPCFAPPIMVLIMLFWIFFKCICRGHKMVRLHSVKKEDDSFCWRASFYFKPFS